MVRLERVSVRTIAPVPVEVRELAQPSLALDQPLEEHWPVDLRVSQGVEVAENALDELVDRIGGKRSLVRRNLAQSALAISIREVELADADGDHGRSDEYHDDNRVP